MVSGWGLNSSPHLPPCRAPLDRTRCVSCVQQLWGGVLSLSSKTSPPFIVPRLCCKILCLYSAYCFCSLSPTANPLFFQFFSQKHRDLHLLNCNSHLALGSASKYNRVWHGRGVGGGLLWLGWDPCPCAYSGDWKSPSPRYQRKGKRL